MDFPLIDQRPLCFRGVRGDAPCYPKHTMVMVRLLSIKDTMVMVMVIRQAVFRGADHSGVMNRPFSSWRAWRSSKLPEGRHGDDEAVLPAVV